MKKLLIGVVAALCCFALAAPAFAEVKVGGMVQADAYYLHRDGETVRGGYAKNPATVQGRDDLGQWVMDAPIPYNRLNVKYTSDDKKIGGYIELRGGGSAGGTTMSWYYGWIDWNITNAFSLRIGRQFQIFAGPVPPTFLGYQSGHTLAIDYGNIHGTGARDGIRAIWDITDAVKFQFMIEDPHNTSSANELIPAFPARNGGVNGEAVFEDNAIPRLSFSLPVKIGNFTIEPSAMWLQQTYEGVVAGSDDSFDIWGISLYLKAVFGPFSIAAEITYGENLGVGNTGHDGFDRYAGLAYFGGPSAYVDTAGNFRVEDTQVFAFWISPGFNFGPFSICGLFGYQNSQNDGNPATAWGADAAEWDVTRYQYGLYFPIHVAKNFLIQPEIMIFDNGDDQYGPTSTAWHTDFGNEYIIGATFQLVF